MDYKTRIIIEGDKAEAFMKRFEKAMLSTDKAVAKLHKDLNKLNLTTQTISSSGSKASKSLDKMAVSSNNLSKSVNKTNKSLTMMEKLGKDFSFAWRIMLGGYMAQMFSDMTIEIAKSAEAIDLLNKKISFFTKNTSSLDIMKKSSIEVGYSLAQMGKIVTRFAITTKNAFSTKEMVSWTETLVKSARAAGTTTMELNNALIQLSQAFSAGRLMGDEYRSISENLPMLKLALEEAFEGTIHANTGLKKLAGQGEITTEIMIKAFGLLKETVDPIPGVINTIDASLDRMNTSYDVLLNTILGNSGGIKDFFNFLAATMAHLSGDKATISGFNKDLAQIGKYGKIAADGLKELYEVLKVIAVIAVSNLFAKITAGIYTFLTATKIAGIGLTVFTGYFKILFAAGGPIALGITLLGSLGYALYDYISTKDDATESAKKQAEALESENKKLEQQYQIQLKIEGLNGPSRQYADIDEIEKWSLATKKAIGLKNQTILLNEKAKDSIISLLNVSNNAELSRNLAVALVELKNKGYELDDSFKQLIFDLQVLNNQMKSTNIDKTIASYNTFILSIDSAAQKEKRLIEGKATLKKGFEALNTPIKEQSRLLKLLEENINGVNKKENKFNQYQKDVNKAIQDAQTPLEKYNKDLEYNQKMFDKLSISKKVFLFHKEKITKEYMKASGATKALTDLMKEEEKAAKALIKSEEKIIENKQKLIEKYDPLIAVQNEYKKEIEKIALLFGNDTPEAIKMAVLAFEKFNQSLIEAAAAAGHLGAKFTLMWQEFANGIDQNVAGLFSDVLNGEEDAWNNFTDRIKTSFFDMIADMAVELLKSTVWKFLMGDMDFGGFSGAFGDIASMFSGDFSFANTASALSTGSSLYSAGTSLLGLGGAGYAATSLLPAASGGTSVALGSLNLGAPMSDFSIALLEGQVAVGEFSAGVSSATSGFSAIIPYFASIGLVIGSFIGRVLKNDPFKSELRVSTDPTSDAGRGSHIEGLFGDFWVEAAHDALDSVDADAYITALQERTTVLDQAIADYLGEATTEAVVDAMKSFEFDKSLIAENGQLPNIEEFLIERYSAIAQASGGDFAEGYALAYDRGVTEAAHGEGDFKYFSKEYNGTSAEAVAIAMLYADASDIMQDAYQVLDGTMTETLSAIVYFENASDISKNAFAELADGLTEVSTLAYLTGDDLGHMEQVFNESLDRTNDTIETWAGETQDWIDDLHPPTFDLVEDPLNPENQISQSTQTTLTDVINNFIELDSVLSYVGIATLDFTQDNYELYDSFKVWAGGMDGVIEKIGNFQALNAAFDALGIATFELTMEGVKAADALIQAAGGFEELDLLIGNFFDKFATEEEKALAATELYAQRITELNEKYGLSVDTVSASYKDAILAMLNSTDISGEAKVAYLELADLAQSASGGIINLSDSLETLNQSIADTAESFYLDILEDADKSEYYQNLIDEDLSKLKTSTDEEEIAALSNSILDLAQSRWNLLDKEARITSFDDYIAGLDYLDTLTQDRYAAIGYEGDADLSSINPTGDDQYSANNIDYSLFAGSLEKSSETQVTAAETQSQAAANMKIAAEEMLIAVSNMITDHNVNVTVNTTSDEVG